MDIRVQTLVDDLKTRPSSLEPPYPTFGDHVRQILRFVSAPQLGELVGVREGAVNDWSADGTPGTQLWGPIKEMLGYDMSEHAFSKAAAEVGFPERDRKSPEFSPELLKIKDVASLRRFFVEAAELVVTAELARACGIEKSTMTNFTTREINPRADMYAPLLKGVMELAFNLDGTKLSTATPHELSTAIAEGIRKEKGLSLTQWAEALCDPDGDLVITRSYYTHWKNPKPSGERNYYRERDRVVKMLKRIDKIRYGEVTLATVEPVENQQVASSDVVAPAENIPSNVNDELLQEVLGVHSELHEHTKLLAAALDENRRELTGRLSAVNETLVKVHDIMKRYGQDSCDLEPEATDSEGSNGAKSTPALGVDTRVPPHLPPLSHKRGQTHNNVPDKYRLRLLRVQMQVVAEELGQILLLENRDERERVCDELAPERHELTVAVRAVSLVHPAGQYDIWDAQRKTLGLFADLDEAEGGEDV